MITTPLWYHARWVSDRVEAVGGESGEAEVGNGGELASHERIGEVGPREAGRLPRRALDVRREARRRPHLHTRGGGGGEGVRGGDALMYTRAHTRAHAHGSMWTQADASDTDERARTHKPAHVYAHTPSRFRTVLRMTTHKLRQLYWALPRSADSTTNKNDVI